MKTLIDAVNEFKGEVVTGNFQYVCNQSVGFIHRWSNKSLDDLAIPQWSFLCTEDEFLATVAECETNFGKCGQSYSDYKFDYHLHPALKRNKPTPIFTQEMADNAVLPSVGMECLMDGTEIIYVVVLPADNEGDLILTPKDEDGNYWQHSNVKNIKPLTPPKTDKEKAIDEYIESQHHGLDSLSQSIKTIMKNAFEAGVSFQPLTVEVK